MKIFSLDREMVLRQLEQAAMELVGRNENVKCVFLFGSLARGEASVRSDADVCVLLDQHPERRWFDRIREFEDFFLEVGIGVDLFPYTVEELKRGLKNSGFFRQMIREARVLSGTLPDDLGF